MAYKLFCYYFKTIIIAKNLKIAPKLLLNKITHYKVFLSLKYCLKNGKLLYNKCATM